MNIQYDDWTEEYENLDAVHECPNCGWDPDCEDSIIARSPKKYSYHLSMLSSFPQYTWCEVYICKECDTLFKMETESI